jgi:hypothetical protein
MSETRKIAAILVADVVGYSRLADADEERTLARLRALRTMTAMGLCHSNDTRSTNGGRPRASQSLSREATPLDQRGRASLFVNLAGHEMTLLVEMIVDLRVN